MKTNPVTKIIAAVLIPLSLLTIFLPWVKYLDWSMFDMVKMTMGDGDLSVGELMCIVMLVTTILGVILSLKGKKLGAILHFIVTVAIFVYLVSDSGSGTDFLAIGAWLCPILALGAVICMFIPEK